MAKRGTSVAEGPGLDFLQFNDLACETVGGKVLFATDEYFAPASNLLKGALPQFDSSAFTEFGKWMDGWETRRKRIPGHDWCIIQLGVPGRICGFDVDTSFFTGNHSPRVSIQGTCLDSSPDFSLKGNRTGMAATDSEFAEVAKLRSEAWPELVPVSPLMPGFSDCCHNFFTSSQFTNRVTHLRLNMYPDGGIARLRVLGIGQRNWASVSTHEDVDLVALPNGGVCLGFSNAHFGHPRNMIGLGQAVSMADGWETARRLDRPNKLKVDQQGILQVPGREWAVFRLGHPGTIHRVEIDTIHFKGNFPDSCQVEVCSLSPDEEVQCIQNRWTSGKWRLLLPPQKLRPHHMHRYDELVPSGPVTHVRLTIRPDGGISRFRLFGRITRITGAVGNQQRPSSRL
ncbi:allantoicase [Takifugu flavidus]|uniref:Allantoate amidinohydrolase n=1 Tax=Takifugu flavidus TaxID=433684 RepID=A0A5C6NLR4_9TELE|nr:allantoicase [Takifugu flavidus]TWW68394.1 Allantoicase [Takifugu flavidus]